METQIKSNWQYDRETGWHTLRVDGDDDAFVFVYKSGGGDYVISAMREGDPAGGDIEYCDTLKQAKKFGETLIDGAWKDYAM